MAETAWQDTENVTTMTAPPSSRYRAAKTKTILSLVGGRKRFEEVLEGLDRARTWDEFIEAKQRFLELGPWAVEHVLDEVGSGHGTRREDVLESFLANNARLDVIRRMCDDESTPEGRLAALVEVLAIKAESGDLAVKEQVARTLVRMTERPAVPLRVTVIEALGRVGSEFQFVRERLDRLTQATSAAVRRAASSALSDGD